jgi:hypothetical protein
LRDKVKTALFVELVALFEALDPAGGIDHFFLAREKGMALAAQLDMQGLFGRTGGKDVAARTGYLGIGKIFRMDFFFHLVIFQRKR